MSHLVKQMLVYLFRWTCNTEAMSECCPMCGILTHICTTCVSPPGNSSGTSLWQWQTQSKKSYFGIRILYYQYCHM